MCNGIGNLLFLSGADIVWDGRAKGWSFSVICTGTAAIAKAVGFLEL